ncbi:hypothetical protein FACS1894130_10020 [Spirochaetia bacterium]|nr:hypothetical protein FACS1894130_10020 [Spirochaetia bacterium]
MAIPGGCRRDAFRPLRVSCTAALLAAVLGFLASCATAPQRVVDYTDASREFGVLDGGALVYFSVDIPAARPILDLVSFGGTSGKQAAQILDRTETAVGAAYPPESGRRYLLAAQGRYPKSGIDFSLTFNPSWKKLKSDRGIRYWHSERDSLSLLIEPRYALISDGGLFAGPGRVTVPDAFWNIREGAALAGWLEDAAVPINRFLGQLEIPIQVPADRLIFAVFPEAGPPLVYSALLRLETPSVSQAKALASMVSMIRLFVGRPPANRPSVEGSADSLPDLIAALFANTPVQDDTALILKTASLDAEAIALLFTMFSVYSN